MKKIIYTLFLFFLGMYPLLAQESYYYCQERKVYLHENNRVRYVGLKKTLAEDQVRLIQSELNECCARILEFSPYFAKYFILDGKTEQFESVINSNDSLLYLNSPDYASDDTLVLFPARTILVKMKSTTSLLPVLDSIGVPYKNVVQSRYNGQEYQIFLFSDEALRFAALLYETGLFDYAQPDFYSVEQNTEYEDNPHYQDQWAVHNESINMNLLPAWNITTGDPQIKVAVLDNGVELNHPDLIDNLLEGYDAVDDPNHPPTVCCGQFELNNDYHGTLCAGVVGASNNEIGLVGVSHTSKVIPIRINHTVKVYYKEQEPDTPTLHYLLVGATSWKLDAFDHACYDDNADVINCSFTTDATDAIRSKMEEISQNGRGGKGCIIIAGSGNRDHTYPDSLIDLMAPFASQACVISVGGINECGERMRYGNHCNINPGYNSCYGDSLDVMAPGIHIPSTQIMALGEYFTAFGGTSAAAPHVAGVAALVLSVNPCLTREEVKYVIESTCTKIRPDLYTYNINPDHPNGTWNKQVGYGLVNAYAAVQLAQQMGGYTYIRDTVVVGNVVWIGNKMLRDSLIVDSLATLTVTDTVFMSSSCRLIVRPGGKLIVDGGTLTSACPGEMWQGIEVLGDRSKRQLAQYQGIVELRNGATIENAHCGIHTGYHDSGTYATTGGIILADSANFVNNRRSVAFLSYENTRPNGSVANNLSSFRRCVFSVNDNNHFMQDNCPFIDHVTMWEVRGVKFKGCRFENTATMPGDRRHAIYTENAGFEVDSHCDVQYYNGCECPEPYTVCCEFSGFTTAVEANTDGDSRAVLVNGARFVNNVTGVKINGTNFATVTRNDFNLQSRPSSPSNTGLYLNACGGYQVEGNRFHRAGLPVTSTSTGIRVENNGNTDNSIYRNVFDTLSYGIDVYGANGDANGGLQMLCGDFNGNVTDIRLATIKTTVSQQQGSLQVSAGNTFDGTSGYNIQSFANQNIVYYHTGKAVPGNPHYPGLRTTNVFPYLILSANGCASTLCNNGSQQLLAGFQSGMNAYTTALAGNNGDMDGGAGVETQNFAFLQSGANEIVADLRQSLSDTYHTAVRTLMSDSLLDLGTLEQWHAAAQPIADPYSLTETRFCEGYAETSASDADDAEMANYAEFHAMKLALRVQNDNLDNQDNSGTPFVNWYALTPAQIAQLQTIAERNTGRASVMAKGVLCFFHGICYEDDLLVDDNGDNNAGTRAKRVTTDITDDAALTVYPNPTDDLLFVELRGAEIARVALYDLQGRMVTGTGAHAGAPQQGTTATMNMRNVPAGVYLLRVTAADGKEYHQKIVKR